MSATRGVLSRKLVRRRCRSTIVPRDTWLARLCSRQRLPESEGWAPAVAHAVAFLESISRFRFSCLDCLAEKGKPERSGMACKHTLRNGDGTLRLHLKYWPTLVFGP